jgi:septal ring factor EnvC (AmiA/AmiB activator)
MEKNLTKKEEEKAKGLKTKFTEVHAQIQGVQIEIEMLNKKAEDLIKNLEGLRDQEVEFVKSLERKYGPGKLNPFTLKYQQIENETV